MSYLVRYSLIKKKFPREFLLLQGTGCIYKKCKFCDYYNDISEKPFAVNKPIINKITGETGTLDIINSGSCFEIDDDSINLIYEKAKEKNIHTIWFETHYLYHNKLNEFKNKFPGITVKFRTGIETFNPELRSEWNKGINKNVTVADIAKYFDGVCLLIGVLGQTKDDIINDIKIASNHFEYCSVNVFTENTTEIKPDPQLINWFKTDVFPKIKDNPRIEVLLNNTDLGVG